MDFEGYRQHYEAEKAKAKENLGLVEAEVERLKGAVLRFEGAVMVIDELEQADAAELEKKLESHESLSDEDIQRALLVIPEPVPSKVIDKKIVRTVNKAVRKEKVKPKSRKKVRP